MILVVRMALSTGDHCIAVMLSSRDHKPLGDQGALAVAHPASTRLAGAAVGRERLPRA